MQRPQAERKPRIAPLNLNEALTEGDQRHHHRKDERVNGHLVVRLMRQELRCRVRVNNLLSAVRHAVDLKREAGNPVREHADTSEYGDLPERGLRRNKLARRRWLAAKCPGA